MATKFWKSTSSVNFTLAANWSDGVAPANGDTLVFNHIGTANVTQNIETLLTGCTIIVEQSYTGQIGVFTSSLQTYLTMNGGTIIIGRRPAQGTGAGAGLLMFKNDTASGTATDAMTINVYDSKTTNAVQTNYPPVLINGTDITLNISGGNVGVALVPGETSTITEARVNLDPNAGVRPQLTAGIGATVTTLYANTGVVRSYSGQTITAATINGNAEYDYLGTGAHTTVEIGDDGVVYYSGTGTATQINLRGATLDFSRDARAKTITDLSVWRNSRLFLDNGRAGSLTFTNPIQYHDGLDAVQFSSPPRVKGTFTNI